MKRYAIPEIRGSYRKSSVPSIFVLGSWNIQEHLVGRP
uniref:Uncharacterized protein n=1 Tax=Anguilla anguilla TaxID=7936 RepID=A0A0E9R8R5_ANGAN